MADLNELHAGGTGSVKLQTVLNSRVLTSFIRAYADSQFSSESLRFIQAVQQFKDCFEDYVKTGTADKEARALYDTFISAENSKTPICLTSDEYAQVSRMVKRGGVKDAHVFDKFLGNPTITVERDIFPRFCTSPFFNDMRECLEQGKKDLESFPRSGQQSVLQRESPPDLANAALAFSFDDVVADCFMRPVFRAFLVEKTCEAKLDCLDQIAAYQSRLAAGAEAKEARCRMWHIYFHFLQPGTKQDVLVSSIVRHAIGMQLAAQAPPATLFDELERVLKQRLREDKDCWPAFTATAQYKGLVQVLKEAKEKVSKNSSQSCLVM